MADTAETTDPVEPEGHESLTATELETFEEVPDDAGDENRPDPS